MGPWHSTALKTTAVHCSSCYKHGDVLTFRKASPCVAVASDDCPLQSAETSLFSSSLDPYIDRTAKHELNAFLK